MPETRQTRKVPFLTEDGRMPVSYLPQEASEILDARDTSVSSAGMASAAAATATEVAADLTQTYLGGTDAVNDAAVETYVRTQGTATRGTLDATFESVRGLAVGLDIWDAYPHPSSYAAWMTDVQNYLGSAATLTTIGQSPTGDGGTQPIYAYTAGPETAPHALIVGGAHPSEMLSQFAGARFFEEFATSSDPAMVALRSRLRLSWIPCLAPGVWRLSRENANGVDVNRNFPFFWDYNVSSEKGSAPYSETESQALKTFIDDTTVASVIDCHMLGNTGPTMMWNVPSSWTSGGRVPGIAAVQLWEELYNRGTVTVAPLGDGGNDGISGIRNWAQKYLVSLGRENAAALLIDARVDIAGSGNSNGPYTRDGIRLYAGLIHTFLLSWLQRKPETAVTNINRGRLFPSAADLTNSVASGGAVVDVLTETPVTFNSVRGGGTATFIDTPIPSDGMLVITGTILLETIPSATSQTSVQLKVACGKTPVSGGNVALPTTWDAFVYGDVPPSGRKISLSFVRDVPITATSDDVQRVQLFVRKTLSGDANAVIRSATLNATFYPDTPVSRQAWTRRTS